MTNSLAFLAALTATASANSVVATSEPPPARHAVDGRFGLLLGGASVGDASGFSIGFSSGLGYRIGAATLRGLFDYYRVGDEPADLPARHGRAARLGGALRYSFANNGDDDAAGAAIDFWGELGAGYEHVEWRAGGILDRPDAELAVGLDVGGRSARDDRGHRREIGYFMAFRSLIGQAPEPAGAMPTCGGPCTQATPPPRTDISLYFDVGVHWGR